MAVKKTKKEDIVTKVVDSEVEPSVEISEEIIEESVTEESVGEQTIEVEIPVETPKSEEPQVEIDNSAFKVDNNKMPKGNVKIRMRTSHKCTIAMVKYDLKAGKTYTVPDNVKRILDKAGLLAPLN